MKERKKERKKLFFTLFLVPLHRKKNRTTYDSRKSNTFCVLCHPY